MKRRTWLKNTALTVLAGMAPKPILAKRGTVPAAGIGVIALGGAGERIAVAAHFEPSACHEPILVPTLPVFKRAVSDGGLVADASCVWLLVAGLGGDTGTRLAPALAAWLSGSGAIVHAFVSWPFEFEGELRLGRAKKASEILVSLCESVRVFPNDSIFDDPRETSQPFDAVWEDRTSTALRDYHQGLVVTGWGG